MNLDTKQAVRLAKQWAADQLAEEGVSDLGLEEVAWENGLWKITVGFARPWNQNVMRTFSGRDNSRTYKVLTVRDDDGAVISMQNREAA